jgi:alpha-1,3-rhamnosyl/mannosyltransferase
VAEAGADPGSIVVIAHGSDHLPAPDDKGATTLLQRLGVEGDFLLSVGTLEPRKNLVRLSDAYGRVRPKLPTPMPLVVVGPEGWTGSRAPGAHGDTSAPGPDAPGVIATGPVDDAILAALYGRARLLVYVPLTEGFGFPPVEAMRIGTPVVSSPMPSLGGAGLVVDPQNLEEIGTAILRAATDEALRSELVAGGFERAKQLTWAASARRHVDLWESLR